MAVRTKKKKRVIRKHSGQKVRNHNSKRRLGDSEDKKAGAAKKECAESLNKSSLFAFGLQRTKEAHKGM